MLTTFVQKLLPPLMQELHNNAFAQEIVQRGLYLNWKNMSLLLGTTYSTSCNQVRIVKFTPVLYITKKSCTALFLLFKYER